MNPPNPPRFLDTNILLGYFTGDDPVKAAAAFALLERVERGHERVLTSSLVIFETIFTLQRGYKVPKRRVRELMLPILTMRGLVLPDKQLHVAALDLYADTPLSFADAFNATSMRFRGISEIYSWDRDFDRVPGIQRVEP